MILYGPGGELTSDALVDSLMSDYNSTDKSKFIDLAGSIARHESKDLDRNGLYFQNPKRRQDGGGPGSGSYQLEIGVDKGGIVAARRLYNYLNRRGMEVPKWLNSARTKPSLDASKFTPDQQTMLFWGYHRMGPSKLGDYIGGKLSAEDFWGEYHQTKNDPKKKESFRKDMQAYEAVRDKKNGVHKSNVTGVGNSAISVKPDYL